jgi:thiazole synthase ThiGH ThiG subunit
MKLSKLIKESEDENKFVEVIAELQITVVLPNDKNLEDTLESAKVTVNDADASVIAVEVVSKENVKRPKKFESVTNEDNVLRLAERTIENIEKDTDITSGLTTDEYIRYCEMMEEYFRTQRDAAHSEYNEE